MVFQVAGRRWLESEAGVGCVPGFPVMGATGRLREGGAGSSLLLFGPERFMGRMPREVSAERAHRLRGGRWRGDGDARAMTRSPGPEKPVGRFRWVV